MNDLPGLSRLKRSGRLIAPVIGALCLAGVFATPSTAAEGINLNARTARDLAELCGAVPRQAGSDAKINFCHGFAQATVDMAMTQNPDKKPFCFPSPAPRRSETLSEFVAWVKGSADRQRLSSTDGLLQFLGGRFPCTK